MTQHIYLAAMVIREGQLMLIRPQIGAPWELPGGPFLDEHEDMDLAMDALLTSLGINAPAIEEDFIETIFLPAPDGQLIYNLYAPSEWAGEPVAPPGAGVGWFALDSLDGVTMDARVRSGVLRAFGLEGEADPAEILSAMQAEFGFGEAKPEPEPEPEPEREPELAAAASIEPESAPDAPLGPSNAEPLIDVAPPAAPSLFDAPIPSPEAAPEPMHAAAIPEPIINLARFQDSDDDAIEFSEPMSRREAGLDVLRTLSGDDPLAEELLRTGTGDLADSILDFSMGEVWQSPALDRRTRSLEVVAMLAATGKLGSLKSHIGGALNHGATPDEIVETIKMVSVYAGFPAAVEAWHVLAEVFEERGITKEVDL